MKRIDPFFGLSIYGIAIKSITFPTSLGFQPSNSVYSSLVFIQELFHVGRRDQHKRYEYRTVNIFATCQTQSGV